MSVDNETASLLDLIDNDPRPSAEHDRWLIDRAVERVAMKHAGRVSTNDVRRELTGEYGLTVQPQLIGPRLRTLTLQGVLALDGWEENDDKSGNAGKPLRLRRYVGRAAA